MKLNELKYTEGARKSEMRVGRGLGSGKGKNCGTGSKGQKSRSGGGVRPGFEGGQNPLYRRLPKRGFTNYTQVRYAIVNVSELNRFDDNATITPATLIDAGIVKKEYEGVKILGNGELTKKLNVQAHKFSKSAEKAITEVGGKIEVI